MKNTYQYFYILNYITYSHIIILRIIKIWRYWKIITQLYQRNINNLYFHLLYAIANIHCWSTPYFYGKY